MRHSFLSRQEQEEEKNILPHNTSWVLKHLHVSRVTARKPLKQQEIGTGHFALIDGCCGLGYQPLMMSELALFSWRLLWGIIRNEIA
jgi:hypothetical protein